MNGKIVVDSPIIDPTTDINVPYGTYVFRIRVYDADGNTIQDAPLSWDAPNPPTFSADHTTNTIESIGSTDYFRDMIFVPQTPGSHSFCVTSGDLKCSVLVNVSN